jgi:tetratricopeptide (TPR) repeat protein/transcriptional regulator with XRE-family HTH domain
MASVQPYSFGHLLRRYRVAAGLTQEELAGRAGLSAKAVSALESGARRSPRKETVALLVDALSLTSSERADFTAAARSLTFPPLVSNGPQVDSRIGAPLIGRRHERALLDRHFSGGDVPVLLLAGPPGIGKSRLLQEAAEQGAARGYAVLWGGCYRRSGQEPYTPFAAMILRFLATRSARDQRDLLHGCSWLVRLLPELLDSAVVPAPSWELPSQQERRLMFGAVHRLLHNAAGPSGTLLLLDDLQWADADALDLLATVLREHVAADQQGWRLRIVGAYRDTDVAPADPLALHITDLARDGVIVQRELTSLSRRESADLLGALVADRAPDVAASERMLDRAAGVPFFLVSLAQELQAHGQSGDLAEQSGGDEEVPWTVAESIRSRVALLPPPAAEVLTLAAVAGRAMHHRVLLAAATSASLNEQGVVAAIEAACRAQLLAETREGAYTIAHDLIRDVVMADLRAAHRALLHRRMAEALERVSAGAPPEVLAYHFSQGGETGRAIAYLERAGDRADALHAHAEAAGYYHDLVERLDALGRVGQATRMREKLASTLTTIGRYDHALEALERAADLATISSDRDAVMRIVAQIAEIHALRGTAREGLVRVEALASASDMPVSDGALSELQVALAELYFWDGHYARQIEVAQQGVALARTAQDVRLQARAGVRHGAGLVMLGRMTEACVVLEETLLLAGASADLSSLAFAFYNLSLAYQAMGEFERDKQYIERALEVAEGMNNPMAIAFMLVRRAVNAFWIGEWDRTRADCERAIALSEQVYLSRTTAHPLLLLGVLHQFEGKEAAAAPYLASGIALAQRGNDLVSMRWLDLVLAERDLLEGRPHDAYARLAPHVDRYGQEEALVTQMLPHLARAHLDMGEEKRGEELMAWGRARAMAANMRPALTDVLCVQAHLAIKRGQWRDAESVMEEALVLSRAMGVPTIEMRVLYIHGQLHVARREPEQALTKFEQALAICARLGEGLYRKYIEHALAEQGHPPPYR